MSIHALSPLYARFWLVSCLLVACGGSASRKVGGSPPPNGGGGDGGDGSVVGAPTGGTGGGTVGGTTQGGAAAGGMGTAGAAGDGGTAGAGASVSDWPLPPGCEPRASEETADSCSLAVYCDTASRLTHCERLGADRFRCQCDPIHPERVYHVEAAAGVNACAVAAAACSDELELGEETCDEASASSPNADCSTELACGRPIRLGVATSGRAWLMRFGSASCHQSDAPGVLTCQCVGTPETKEGLVALGSAPACGPLLRYCLGDTAPEPGEDECYSQSSASSDEMCERIESCVAPMQQGEARFGWGEQRQVTCFTRGDGGSDCACSTATSTLSLRAAAASTDATCEDVMRSCARSAVIEPVGTATCDPSSPESSGPTSCTADLTCLQSAKVDGRPFITKGRLLLSCARVEEGSPWWCSCASDQKTTRFQLGEEGAAASEACSQAGERCLTGLPVSFGHYGETVPPPYPLP